MSVSVVVPHFYSAREPNLRVIVDAFMSGSVRPCEIIIWANEPIRSEIPGASVITSHRNLGAQARFIAALASVGDHVLFVDNDTEPQPRTVENLLRQSFPHRISTLEGRIYNGAPYRATPKVYGRDIRAERIVDLSLGRGEMVPRPLLRRILAVFPFGAGMDDMMFSESARIAGASIYVVPCIEGESALTNLQECGAGMSREPGFYSERDALMRGMVSER